MTVPVTVNATWRLSRVEFNTMHSMPWTVMGNGEVLLQEIEGATGPIPVLGTPREEDGVKTYGAMPAAAVSRFIDNVRAETVVVNDMHISFETIMLALPMFFEKWRIEDAEAPPPLPMMAPPEMDGSVLQPDPPRP